MSVAGLFFLKLVIAVSDERVSFQQMLVGFPLIQNFVALFRLHIESSILAVALAVHALLKSLYVQT